VVIALDLPFAMIYLMVGRLSWLSKKPDAKMFRKDVYIALIRWLSPSVRRRRHQERLNWMGREWMRRGGTAEREARSGEWRPLSHQPAIVGKDSKQLTGNSGYCACINLLGKRNHL
jgi:hypothetical protein